MMKVEKPRIFFRISETDLPRLFSFIGIIILSIQLLSIPALAQTVEYNNGYNLIIYDDGSKEIISGALNFLRHDSVWRPIDEMNISNGSWPYLYSENGTNADFKVDDVTLSIPTANTIFKKNENSISQVLTYSKSELINKEISINLTDAFIGIPYNLKSRKSKTRYEDRHNINYGRLNFRAGKDHITIHDDTLREYIEDGEVFQDYTYLFEDDYDFIIEKGQIRLQFKKEAFEKLVGNVIIEINTWYVDGPNNWGNVAFSQTKDVKATGYAELRQRVDDYVFYTRFDEGTGRTIHNEKSIYLPTGNLNGELTSNTWTTGKYGKSIYFNGIDDLTIGNRILFNNHADIRLPDDFVISAFLYHTGYDNPDTDIMRKGSTSTADGWNKLEVGAGLTANAIYAFVEDPSGKVELKDTNLDRRDGNWHFIVLSRQGTTCKLWIDGSEVKSTTSCPTNTANTAQLSIGAKDSAFPDDYIEGRLDEVRMYDHMLTSEELTSIQNNEHYLSGTITRNLSSVIGPSDELKELGCNGTWDRTITKVDVQASTNNVNWVTIQSNAIPDALFSVSQGNNYKYSRCALSTTDASKTPVIKSIRARIDPKVSVLTAEAGGPYSGAVGALISFTGIASGGTPPYSYNWNFGDGGTSTLANPTHAYANTGSYTAQFTVSDNKGASAYDSAPVTIKLLDISNIVAASGKTYILDTLAVGKLFYIDRTYSFTSVPSAYNGLDYIQTANDDRYNTGTGFLQFDVNTPVTVYVAYDDRISPKASWLSSFTDTGDNLARSDGVTFSIYSKSFPAGHISLDGCSISPTGAGGMYVVIVKPQDLQYINGTIKDNVTQLGISGAIVSTNTSLSTTTTATGFYSFEVFPGTYNITAMSDPVYYSNSTIVSISDTVVTKDIKLQKKPKGRITGNVRS